MKFNCVDMDNWERKPYFEHFMDTVRCTYSMTANIDITSLICEVKKRGIKFYPVIIYMITSVLNNNDEFRTSYDADGKVGIWDEMSPCYTVFNKDTKTFSNIWTTYSNNFSDFYKSYLSDVETYGEVKEIIAKKNPPENTFPVSCIPWVSFTGFNLNIFEDGKYLLPIFTVGRYFSQDNKTLLPISIQVHHSVCDGYHTSKFINELEQMSIEFDKWID